MYIHDDANAETVTKETVAAILEGARHVGKADRTFDDKHLAEIDEAIRRLESVVILKRKMNADRS